VTLPSLPCPPMRSRHLIACGLAALSLAAAGCGNDGSGASEEDLNFESQETQPPAEEEAAAPPADAGADRAKPKIEIPKGKPPAKLKSEDLIAGKGAAAESGQSLSVNYVGVSYSTGKEFDSNFGSGQPFEFDLGGGMVIPGWDQGLEGMKVGGRRKLTIPGDLAYGPQGQPPDIKPNETLVFVIDLLGAQ